MTWKRLNNGHFGRADVFGGEDIDKISKLFDGTEEVDNVDFNSTTTIRSGNFKFRNPDNTFSYSVTPSAITADRNLTMPILTSDQQFLFENAAQTMTGQHTFNACIWESTGVGTSKFAGDPIPMRWGAVFPVNAAESTTGAAALEGILSRHTLRNTNGNPRCEWTSAGSTGYEGQSIRFENLITDGDYSGIISPTSGVGLFRMSHDGLVRIRFSQEQWVHSAIVFGLSSSSAAPLNANNPLGNTHSGIIVGDSESANWGFSLYNHDGDGTAANKTLLADLSNIGVGGDIFKEIEIKWYHDGTGLHARASVGNVHETGVFYRKTLQSSELPAATTDLYFHCHFINTTGSNTNEFHLAGLWAESL